MRLRASVVKYLDAVSERNVRGPTIIEMGRFIDLRDLHRECASSELIPFEDRFRLANERVAAEFPDVASKSSLSLANASEPPRGSGIRLRIGVALWSLSDLKFLDRVDEHLGSARINASVEVVDLDYLAADKFPQGFPLLAIHRICVTPIACVWLNSVCVACAQGWKAQRLVARNLEMAL